MKIALMPSAYAPAVGGVERLTARLASHLQAAGDEVEVWTMRHPPSLATAEVVSDIVIRRFEFVLPPARLGPVAAFPMRAGKAVWRLHRAIRDFEPDLVHVQCFSAGGTYAVALTRLHGLPLVISLQGETFMDDHDIYERSAVLRLALRVGLRHAAAVTGCSRFVVDDAVTHFGLDRGRGQVIFNGVDCENEVEPTPMSVPFRRFILGVGRVVAKKGFDLLVAAFARLPRDFCDVGLVIAGAGPELTKLLELVERLGISDRVHFPGMLDRARVSWIMAQAEVFVLPSRVEPFGIVVLEAMHAGRPVVVSNAGGASEIVHTNEQGIVVDPSDLPALTRALVRLLGDADLRFRMGQAAKRRAAAFEWSVIAEEYRAVYRSVIAANDGAPR